MTKVAIVDLTKLDVAERRDMARLAMVAYVGERCKFCGHEFRTVDDLIERHVVWAGIHEHGRVACKTCWEAQDHV